MHISVEGDTVINDTNCRILSKDIIIYDHLTAVTDTGHIGNIYMASDEDRVFIYANNKFYSFFDFNSEVGNSWIIPQNESLSGNCESEGKLIVTETGIVSINGQELRKIVVQAADSSHWGYGWGEIVEKIGPLHDYMLPQPTMECGIADLFEGGPLRCYYDDDFGLYSTGYAEECDFTVGIYKTEEIQFEIFPNPCSEFINIKFPNLISKNSIWIYDISGKLGITLNSCGEE